MGLDTSHGCWAGSYSAFNRWRRKINETAGYGDWDKVEYFPDDDPLVDLLNHSDCEGELLWERCGLIADRLVELMPSLKRAGEGGGHIGDYADKTQIFIDGLREAFAAKENVEFM